MKQYETYKDSGVEWLGEIPEHWEKSSLKWYSTIYSGGTPSKVKDDYWVNGNIPWLNSGTVNQGDITKASNYITEEAFQNSSAKWIPNKSLIIALAGQGKTKGMVGQVQFETTCNQSLGVIVPNNKIFNRFLYYWLKNNYQNIRNLGGGDKRDGLNLVMIGGIPIPVPSIEEQTQIANYLNHKTAQLDTLIAKKEQLINLLQEERTAMINQAVTKGLDPNVPMKDSGIEWLGEIPAHWMKTGLNKIIKVKDGTHESPKSITKGDNTFPLITSKDFRNGKIIFENAKHISSEDHYNIIKRSDSKKGDIIMSMIGGNIGNMVLIDTDKEFSIKNVCLFKTSGNEIKAKHLYYILKSSLIKIQIDLCSRGGAQGFLSLGDLRNLVYFVIPKSELKTIVKYLDEGTARIDVIISKTKKEIELLKEYKTALISEVVTGKVDVREEILN